MITINDLTESLLDPRGRFRALEGIYAAVGTDGAPRMLIMRDRAIFDTVYDGAPRRLVCPLREGPFFRETPTAGGAYLPHTTVFPGEMRVYSLSDQEYVIDVALQSVPDGIALQESMDTRGRRPSRQEISDIFDGLCGACGWAAEKLYSSRSVRVEDIFITGDRRVLLTGHTQDIAGRAPAASSELTATLLLFFLFSIDIRYLDEFRRTRRFSYRSITEYLSLFGDAGYPAWQPFFSLLPIALTSGRMQPTAGFIAENISRLRLAVDDKATIPPLRRPDTLEAEKTAMPGYDDYTHVGPPCDGLSRIMQDGMWRYIDGEGCPAFEGSFLGASDFEAGRAVVETGRGTGMIDTSGRWIIEPTNDEICHDAADGLARVGRGGLFALFTDEGRPLTGFVFDSLERQSCGLLPAQMEGMYGYIHTDGTTAIDFVYDEAYGFRGGRATVDLAGEQFEIDTAGKRV